MARSYPLFDATSVEPKVVRRLAQPRPMMVAALFAGIGGIEEGFHRAGHTTKLLCEIEPAAQRVLATRFPNIPLMGDVRDIDELPDVDIVTAGFPCQDLSQAGRTVGIDGAQSGLVGEVFRLLGRRGKVPKWLLLENVPFMLHLDRGRGMRFLVDWLEANGYSWAYRVVDTRAFGLPQRRQRVLLLASRSEDPREVLLVDDAGEPIPAAGADRVACGFYWTEGYTGLGWAEDAVPTLKGGSTIGIPSPPGIWMLDGSMAIPDIRDAERLQGFPDGWTLPAVPSESARKGPRWKLVGNAVSVPVAEWLGRRLSDPQPYESSFDEALPRGVPWPKAAWGKSGATFRSRRSAWPVRMPYQHLADFVRYPSPLSVRAARGFLGRATVSSLRFPVGFLPAVEEHIERQTRLREAA